MKDDISQFDKNYFGSAGSEYKRYKDAKKMRGICFPKSVLEEKIQPKSKVLDIGCTFGFFLKLCDEYNLETYGLDISDYATKKAKKITKAKLYLRNINDMLDILSDEYFDLVISTHAMASRKENLKGKCQ